jgi:hypothetical protein
LYSPRNGDLVTISYEASLKGPEQQHIIFESTKERGSPFSFTMGRVTYIYASIICSSELILFTLHQGHVLKGLEFGVKGMVVGASSRKISRPAYVCVCAHEAFTAFSISSFAFTTTGEKAEIVVGTILAFFWFTTTLAFF